MHNLKKEGKIFVISAPSGTGKSTIVRQLMKKTPGIKRSISYTTRHVRKGEVHKKDYFFIDSAEFKRKIKEGFFAEWARVCGNYYGTSHSFINKVIKSGKNLVLAIDTQGALQIRRKYPYDSILIFVLPPSMEELEKRLRKRGTETPQDIVRRLQTAKKEIQKIKYYNRVIVNKKVGEAVEEIKKMLKPGGKIEKNNG